MLGETAGSANISVNTVLVPYDYPVRIFNINYASSGTNIPIKFLSGVTTGAAGTVWLQDQNTGTANYRTVDFGTWGHYLPQGVYVQLDAAITSATILFKREPSNR